MDSHWRNTMRPARFFFMDARCSVFILFFLVHIRLWTFVLALVMIITFWLFERRDLTFEAALRALRVWILGSNRPGRNPRAYRRWVDYGGL